MENKITAGGEVLIFYACQHSSLLLIIFLREIGIKFKF